MIIVVVIIVLLILLACTCAGCAGYNTVTAGLDDPALLQQQQYQFQTTTIRDRYGDSLFELNDPNFGSRTYVTLDQISPYLLDATIATEDRNFYEHPGVDPIAITRAIYYNVTEGSIVSGASTITQQVARNVYMTPEERQEQSMSRKIREAILAVRLANQFSREEILEVYVNQIYYGNRAYGIEAAAQTYFGKEPFGGEALPPGLLTFQQTASELTLAEAALLAGLPQSPTYHDPNTYPERAKRRQEIVLDLMVKAKKITQAEADEAKREPVLERLVEPTLANAVPHFVNIVLTELETNPPAGYTNLYEAGLDIQTTLDPDLQAIAEQIVTEQVDLLAERNVTNGALVAVQPDTGQVLAFVGSKDFLDPAISGQVNMAVTPRQPGSSIKPFVYLNTLENGWAANTIILDEPVAYPDGQGGFYEPTNYDLKFHGPTFLRTALATSYNIPAVKALEFIGIPQFRNILQTRFGLNQLADSYGLALALGAGEATLVEMTGAYQALANEGARIPPYTIARILDGDGQDITPPRPIPKSVIRKEYAYLMTHLLADNEARAVAFGSNSALKLSRPSAAKTGTTNDFRDNWVMGYTPDLVVGVWVGNADYSPMQGTTGLSGAGPIWHEFMERAHEDKELHEFIRPDGIEEREICANPSAGPDDDCPQRRTEVFVSAEVAANPFPTGIPNTPTPAPPTPTDMPTGTPTMTPIAIASPIPFTPTPTPIQMDEPADPIDDSGSGPPTQEPVDPLGSDSGLDGQPVDEVDPLDNSSGVDEGSSSEGGGSLEEDDLLGGGGSGCALYSGAEFAGLWNQYQVEVGCPTGQFSIVPTIAEEAFQGGTAFWRSDTDEVYVIFDRQKSDGANLNYGSWQTAGNNKWDGSNPDGVGMSPPAGLVEPKRGFGWLWRTYLGGPQGPLGWALDREYGFDNIGRAQSFERGAIFVGSSGKIYLLLNDGRFVAQ
ncbi:transglycosylase domain-containing protein [Anaerolineales bacterium HSG6]|nr:transglycosylase domain-containing protein [Anaerolineales bacterium HSG6]